MRERIPFLGDSPAVHSLNRVAVIGTSASGKTTFAGRLARALGFVHIELDQLHWLPGWEMRPLAEFRAQVVRSTAGDSWVIDGNYGKVRDLIWPRATHIVWLNYSFPVVMFRAIQRTLQRVITQQELHGGNRETLRQVVFNRESIPWWVVRTYRRRRREYPQLFRQPSHRHLEVIEFRRPRASQEWLERIEALQHS